MKAIRCMTWILAILLGVFALGCTPEGTPVFVQAVSDLNPSALKSVSRFAGVVVAENLAEVEKDADKPLKELLVSVGDEVTEGQPLFLYNTDELELALDKQRLEYAQLTATIENYKAQIEDLKEDREDAKESEQLSYTIEIQTAEIDLKEAELSLASMETTIASSEALLENATVYAPVSGRILSITEGGMDNYGNPLPYITIQQAGAFRIKAMLGELQLGLMEGTRMQIVSRTDPSFVLYGTVSFIDYSNPTQGSSSGMYYGMVEDEMTSSSKYPFYIVPDSSEGLMLGQHVYVEPAVEEAPPSGLLLPASFVCYEEDGTPFVWAEQGKRLSRRTVVLGEYDSLSDAFVITEGLSPADYVAFPNESLCVEGAPVTHSLTTDAATDEEVLLP